MAPTILCCGQEEHFLALKNALEANLRLQRRLKEALEAVEHGVGENADAQAKVQLSALRAHRSGWYTGLKAVEFPTIGLVGPKAVGPSRFWMAAGKVPEPNGDTRKLLQAYKFLPNVFTVHKWSSVDDTNLERAILDHVKEAEHSGIVTAAINNGTSLNMPEFRAKTRAISELTLSSRGVEERVTQFEMGQTWELIATQLACGRSAAECANRWTNYLRPSLKIKGKGEDSSWSVQEDSRLILLAKLSMHTKWDAVAEKLGKGCSPIACLARAQQLKACSSSRDWTPQEIKQLQLSFAKNAGKGAFWKAIASDLPGRTPEQAMHFWRNHMGGQRKGKWSAAEDDALLAAVKVLGRKWARVAEAVPSRTQVQCRERFVNVLDPGLKKGQPWSPEEEQILLKGCKECKNEDGTIRWADVAKRLPGRTDDAVSNKFIGMGSNAFAKAL